MMAVTVCANPFTLFLSESLSQAEQLSVPNGGSSCCKAPLDSLLLIPSGVVALLLLQA